jgi:hypothetical protein
MSFFIETYNVLLYEPASVRAELRIAPSILAALENKANGMIQGAVLPELVKLGLVPARTSLLEFAAHAYQLPEPIAAKITMPEDERFVLNVAGYEQLGSVPGVLGDFAKLYAQMAPGGIAATFFNTARQGGLDDYQRLAEIMDSFPAVQASTWIVTNSLREPMSDAFRQLVEKRAGSASPAGAAARRLAVTTGSPCYVPIGDSIVMRAAGEATAVILERLKFLRKFGRHAS